jgi:predicted ATPase
MIRRIKIDNFKCFKEVDLPFSNLTVLTGPNGSGKSTIIQAILLLKQSLQERFNTEEKLLLNGELVSIGTAHDALYQYRDKRHISISVTTDKEAQYTWTWDATDLSLDNLPSMSPPQVIDSIKNASELDIHYISTNREAPRIHYQLQTAGQKQGNGFVGHRGELTPRILSNSYPLKVLEGLHHPQASGNSLYEEVNAWMSELKPGTRVSATEFRDLDLVQLMYAFRSDTDVGNDFRPTNVGFGFSYVLPVIVALLTAKPNSTLIIENPESHLHPKGQSTIGRLLASAASCGVQVIIETHSDHVLNGIRLAVKKEILQAQDALLYFCSESLLHGKISSQAESIKIDSEGKINSWPSGFFDQMDNDFSELFGV